MNLKRKFFLFVVFLLATVGISSCIDAANVVKISFSSDHYTVKEGQTVSLEVNINAGSNYNADEIKNQLVFSSSDESVATFVNGNLVGVGIGETEIKVEWSQKVIVYDKASVTVLISDLPDIVFTDYSSNMLKGSTQTIGYRFNPSYTDATVRWESANPDVATVDEDGKVTAVSVGEASIIAYSTDGVDEKAFILKIAVSESDFAINYVLNGGVNNEANPAGYNTLATPLELSDPTKVGYTFAGWYSDAECTEAVTAIAEGQTGDVTVYAKWEINTYNITYVLNGGEAVNAATYTVEDEVELVDATKTGYEFKGWLNGSETIEKIVAGTTGDITLEASFEAIAYAINYDLDGGVNAESNPATYTVEDEVTLAEPTKDNYIFQGWVDAEGNAVTSIAAGSTGEVSVKATWKVSSYSVTYNLNGGSFVLPFTWQTQAEMVADFIADYNAFANKTAASNGSDFFARSWMGDGSSSGYNLLVSEKYSAKWGWMLNLINDARVAREASPLSASDGQAEARGEIHNLLNLCAPSSTTANYGSDYSSYDYATYAVKYMTPIDGGATPVYSYVPGTEVALPSAVKDGYAFIGLGTEKASIETNASTGYWANYANSVFMFQANNYTNATFSFRASLISQDDGSFIVGNVAQSGGSFTNNGDYVLLISESHSDYWTSSAIQKIISSMATGDRVIFEGNYTTGVGKITVINVMDSIPASASGDLELNAYFVELKDENGLTLNAGEGVLDNAPTQYLTSTGLDLSAYVPERTGYTFLGWSYTAGGSVITAIPQGRRGDVTLYAVYEATTYKIEYELNGGTFAVDSTTYIYDTYDEMVADFIADYSAKFGLSGVTTANFNTKSANYGFVNFWNDATLSAKWGWLQEFILGYQANYSGLTYMKNASSATNYNKYWRANVAAFLQQTKLTSPLTMDFTGLDTESFWATYVPTKTVTVAANPVYEYTVEDLPLVLETPMRDGVTFVGWCDNEYFKREFTSLPAGTIGDVKLYAKWSDTKELVEMKDINYVLNDGTLGANSPAQFEVDKGVKLVDAVRTGYTFLGWTKEEGSTDYITEISASERNAVTLYANWEENEYSIEYVLNGGAFTETYMDTETYTETEGSITPAFGLEEVASIQTTSASGYWSTYQTEIFLIAEFSPLYAYRIFISRNDAGAYVVDDVAQSGESYAATTGQLVISISDSNNNYAALEEFRNSVTEGQIVIFDGDISTGVTTAKFYQEKDEVEGVASIQTTSASGYWSTYQTEIFLIAEFSPLYAYRIFMELNESGAYVVTHVAQSGESYAATTGQLVISISDSNNNYAALEEFRNSVVEGQIVKIDGDISTGVTTATFFNAEDVVYIDSTVEVEKTREVEKVREFTPVTSYTINDLPLTLPTPTLEGKKFIGWYTDENYLSEAISEITVDMLGDVKVYARFEDPDWTPAIRSTVTFELDGGVLEDAITAYDEGKVYELPTPTKEGYEFLGWVTEIGNVDFVTEISAESTGDLVFYAVWYVKQEVVITPEGPATLEVGEGKTYETIAAALAAASNGDIISLAAGTYTLDGAINKSVTFKGVSAEETIISVTAGSVSVAADEVIFDSVTLKGAGGGAGVPGVYFQATSATHIFTVKNSHITAMNTFVKFQSDTTNPVEITVENSTIDYIGQFLFWVTKGLGTLTFTSNTLDASTCGAIANTAAALFRIRSGSAYVYDNVFTGTTQAIDGLFEAGVAGQEFIVKYNTFENVNKIVHINGGNSIVFDENLYLNASNEILDAAPSTVAGDGVTADATVCTSEADRAQRYNIFVNGDGKIVVGAGQTYETISAALEAASAGDVIYVLAGTYAEEINVNKSVTIQGPNYGVNGAAERQEEAVITMKFTISASDVVIDGLKFTESGAIVVAADNVTITNIYAAPTPLALENTNRYGVITNTAVISNLVVTNSYLNSGSSTAQKSLIATNSKVTNLTITNNTLVNTNTATSAILDGLYILTVGGEVRINNNTFDFTTDNYDIFVGSYGNTCTLIEVKDNVFASVNNYTCGNRFQNVPADCEVYYVGNYHYYTMGNTFNFGSSNAAANVYVMYNYFDEHTAFKMNTPGSAKFTFVDNYYGKSQVYTTPDYGTIASKEALEEAYAAYKLQQEIEAATIYYSISYVLNGGTNPEDAPERYEDSVGVVLPTPTKEAYDFLGWTLVADGEKMITEIPSTYKGDVTLYAHWQKSTLKVGDGKQYATIAEALAAAVEGDVIELFAGTYDEAVVITKDNIKIIGANAGVSATSERAEESVITGTVTVAKYTTHFTIDGVELSAESAVELAGYNYYIEIANVSFTGTATSDTKAMVHVSGRGAYVDIHDCKFVATSTASMYYRPIFFESTINNINITNNYFTNNFKSDQYTDIIRLNYAGGIVVIEGNTIENFGSNNWGFFIGYPGGYSAAAIADGTEIYILNNTFTGNGDQICSGISIRSLDATNKVVISGNTFSQVGGTILQVFGLAAGSSTVVSTEVSYNSFVDTSTKVQFGVAASGVNMHDNYAFQAWTGSSTFATADVVEAPIALADLDTTKVSAAPVSSDVYSRVYYVANGGTVEGLHVYREGTANSTATPTRYEYEFLGWTTTPNGTDYITEISADTTGDITLYAQWKYLNYASVELEANGGSVENMTEYSQGVVNTLPTPTKAGYVFKGWYFEEDFSGEPIYEIAANVSGDIKLYALWQVEGSFNVTYVLNGAQTLFADRADLVSQFIVDYNAYTGKKTTADNFFNVSYGASIEQVKAFFQTSDYSSKWGWMYDYFQTVMETNEPKDFATEVAQVRANIHNFLNANSSSVYGADFSTFAYANGFWDLIQTTVTEDNATDILKAYYPYHTFIGWYDNENFDGEPVRVLSKDQTLYAKFVVTELTLTYVVNNSEATMETTKTFTASDSFELDDPEFNSKYWVFNGWYLDEKFTLPITAVAEGNTSNVTVYGSWTEITGYTITYVLNGGSIIYADRAAVVDDFIADYNAAMGTSYTSATVPTGSWDDINYHTFFTKVLDDGTNIRSKWLWLAQYLYDVSKANLASNNCNVLGLAALINESGYSGDAIYGISYAFRAFLAGATVRPNTSYTSVDFSIYENAHGFWSYESAVENGVYLNNKGTVTLADAHLENYDFDGWYLNADCTGDPVKTVDDTVTVYAKYKEGIVVDSITITNPITELTRFSTYQLAWAINPSNANISTVKFSSSNEKIATVSQDGLIEAVSVGTVTITITSLSSSGAKVSMEIEVYSPDHFEAEYLSNSYVEIGDQIALSAEYVKRDGSSSTYTWKSLNEEIATVDSEGVVLGVSAGVATIRVSVSDDVYFDFVVTVLEEGLSDELKFVVSAHNSNVFTRYNLGIGAGTPVFYRDIVGSISNILYNDALEINRQYEETQAGISSNHGGTMTSVEFITVHYTGNMAYSSTASANANYFATGGGGTSIHYVTGNDGVFSVLDDSLVAYHAGDGTSTAFTWTATGVKVDDDQETITPTWGITENSKFSINGKETSISVPAGSTAETQHLTSSTFTYNGVTQNAINDMGLPWKIVDGEYYMGTVWWCYTQVAAGRICSKGGNLNSIGIETAVNPESDLWYTWEKTAQLVAKLMVENNLDITRVKGHHFYSGKDCPQPLLENDLEIWNEFIKMVECEYEVITTYKDVTFTMEIVGDSTVCYDDNTHSYKFNVNGTDRDIVLHSGRVLPNSDTQVITYKVTVTKDGQTQEITLASLVNSIYAED